MRRSLLLVIVYAVLLICSLNASGQQLPQLPDDIMPYIQSISYGKLENYQPTVQYSILSKSLVHVYVSWNLQDYVKQDDLQINIFPAFKPVFNWSPHLTPTDDHIIAQHVFRTPAMIVSSGQKQLVIIPDIDILKKGSPVDWYMDMNAPKNKLTVGMSGIAGTRACFVCSQER